MSAEDKVDLIVAGGGLAGLTAGYVAAKEGLSVLVIERGNYSGSKNVMGGVLYSYPLKDLIPSFWEEAPVEREIEEENFWFLTEDAAFKVGHKNKVFSQKHNNFTVFRAKFDRWFASKFEEVAEKSGGMLIPETRVDEVLVEDGRVVGVTCGGEKLYSNCVIIADGVTSLLTEKLQLRPPLTPNSVALAIKEVLSLPSSKIEDRFCLEKNTGATIELYGYITRGMLGTGFIYTNKDTLSIGIGCLLSDFLKTRVKPYELLDSFKSHPVIKPLLEGTKEEEYLAHLIPEAGYNALPKLYGEGVMVVGDAALLVNSIHREGSNLAIASGKMASEVVVEAHKKGDFSSNSLSVYEERLRQSFVIKDLQKYANLFPFLGKNPQFLTTYIEVINKFFEEMLTVDGVPKQDKQKAVLGYFLKKRNYLQIFNDIIGLLWRIK